MYASTHAHAHTYTNIQMHIFITFLAATREFFFAWGFRDKI